MHRLFIGLMTDTSVHGALTAHRATWQWPPGMRLTPLPRVHLTLHFLGDVDPAREPELIAALAQVPMRALRLTLRTPQVWRHNGVAVLRPEPDAQLDALHDALAAPLQRLGLLRPGERWTPHLTLARHAARATPPARTLPIPWHVDAFSLVQSSLAPQPARYDLLTQVRARD